MSHHHRQSTFPIHTRAASHSTSASHLTSTSAGSTSSSNRTRQYAHLHAALAQLNAHLADTENLLRMTAVQAEYMRGLAGWTGGLFMAAARVLGEETVTGGRNGEVDAAADAEGVRGKRGKQEEKEEGDKDEDGDGEGDENTVVTVTGAEGIAGESSVFEQNVGVGR